MGRKPSRKQAESTLLPPWVPKEKLKLDESCGACLLEKQGGDGDDTVGLTDVCGHTFHGSCILQWAERENSCPQCKGRFHYIGTYDRNGVRQQFILTQKRDQKSDDRGLVLDDTSSETTCRACGHVGDEASLLLCDGDGGLCNAAYHFYCVGLDAIPTEPWFCPTCTQMGADAPPASFRRRRGSARRTPSADRIARASQELANLVIAGLNGFTRRSTRGRGGARGRQSRAADAADAAPSPSPAPRTSPSPAPRRRADPFDAIPAVERQDATDEPEAEPAAPRRRVGESRRSRAGGDGGRRKRQRDPGEAAVSPDSAPASSAAGPSPSPALPAIPPPQAAPQHGSQAAAAAGPSPAAEQQGKRFKGLKPKEVLLKYQEMAEEEEDARAQQDAEATAPHSSTMSAQERIRMRQRLRRQRQAQRERVNQYRGLAVMSVLTGEDMGSKGAFKEPTANKKASKVPAESSSAGGNKAPRPPAAASSSKDPEVRAAAAASAEHADAAVTCQLEPVEAGGHQDSKKMDIDKHPLESQPPLPPPPGDASAHSHDTAHEAAAPAQAHPDRAISSSSSGHRPSSIKPTPSLVRAVKASLKTFKEDFRHCAEESGIAYELLFKHWCRRVSYKAVEGRLDVLRGMGHEQWDALWAEETGSDAFQQFVSEYLTAKSREGVLVKDYLRAGGGQG
ncbi:unnamed protein product [Vitrella brassicaformis CCMP3155]|uniref:PHD-type domain-containing protein n=2 Tax=Vitrella brassicaformis TaxID=1169539 RepID=A0A0G4ELT9_VITBC|nr:unnamed protein product [Vitrella brassicaformis CCMP3155]|eukprot:CEL97798.1 unnamed protein product [Vitrella brassicaformis CCMP3155]